MKNYLWYLVDADLCNVYTKNGEFVGNTNKSRSEFDEKEYTLIPLEYPVTKFFNTADKLAKYCGVSRGSILGNERFGFSMSYNGHKTKVAKVLNFDC